MPSASAIRVRAGCRPLLRSAVVAACATAVAVTSSGCETTQEKAEKQQARAAHILEARAERQRKRHRADGPKTADIQTKSAHRPERDGR